MIVPLHPAEAALAYEIALFRSKAQQAAQTQIDSTREIQHRNDVQGRVRNGRPIGCVDDATVTCCDGWSTSVRPAREAASGFSRGAQSAGGQDR